MSKYTDALRKARARQPRATDLGVCPECGSPLVARDGKWGEFIGCTGYPGCKYTCEVGMEPGPEDRHAKGDWKCLGRDDDGHYR